MGMGTRAPVVRVRIKIRVRVRVRARARVRCFVVAGGHKWCKG